MNYLRTLAVLLALLAISKTASAADPPVNGPPVTVCGTQFDNQNALTDVASHFVRDMRIAKSQGDIAGMNDAMDPNNPQHGAMAALAMKCNAGNSDPKSWTDFRAVCGFDCHVEMAEYYLLLAGDIEYYLAKNPSTNPNPISSLLDATQMLDKVNQGTRIVSSAQLLIGQTVQPGTGGLQGYLSKKGALNLLQAKLYMAQGDGYYKNISDARIQRLAYLVNNAIDADPAAGASSTTLAQAGYDAALMGLNEAMLEIPDDAFFNPLYLEASALLKELQERRDSLMKGLLFIGIDPDEYKIVSIKDQKDRLSALRDQVMNVEGNVENLIKTFGDKESAIQAAQVNSDQTLANQSLSLDSYRIAKIQGLADKASQDLKTALDAAQNNQNLYQQQLAAAEARYNLQKDVLQAQNQLAQLAYTRELDILNYQQNSLQQEQSSLQFVMNYDVTNTNITVQIQGLQAQKATYIDNATKDQLTLNQLDSKIGVAVNQRNQALNNITIAQNNIGDRNVAMTAIYDAAQRGAAAAICSDEAQIAYLSGPVSNPFTWKEGAVNGVGGTLKKCSDLMPSTPPVDLNYPTKAAYLQARCDMKAKASKANITSSADLMICIIGVDSLPASVKSSLDGYLHTRGQSIASYNCSGVMAACAAAGNDMPCDTFTANTKTIYQKRRDSAAQAVKALTDQLSALKSFRDWAEAQIAVQAGAKAADLTSWLMQATALTATEEGTASAPIILAGAAGPFPIAGTGIDLYQESEAAYTTAATIHQIAVEANDISSFIFGAKAKVDELNMQVDKLAASLNQAQISQDLENYASAQAVIEVTGKALDIDTKLEAEIAQEGMDALDCSSGLADVSAQVAQLTFHRASLIAQAKAAGVQNDQIQVAIDNLNLSIANEQLSINSANLSIADLTLEKQKVQSDYDLITTPVTGLAARIDEQVKELGALQTRLAGFKDKQAALAAAQKVILDQTFQTQLNMNADEKKYLTDYIGKGIDHTADVNARLVALQGTIIDQGDLLAQMNGIKDEMLTAVTTVQDQMVTSTEQQIAVTEQDKITNIYLSNEDMVASVTRSVPDFLQVKRRLLQRANYELALLYNKMNALRSTTQAAVNTGLVNPDPMVFVRTGTDLDTVLKDFDNQLFDQQAIIQAQSVTISIPNTSGLARQLSEERQAEFQISPIAANGQAANYGYFALWHDAFNMPQAYTILDMSLKVDFDPTGCQRQHFNLFHEAEGYKFFAPGGGAIEPLLAVGKERLAQPNYFTSDNVPGDNMNDFFSPWTNQLSVYGFWMGQVPIAYDPSLTLPLLGTPVVGSYRITMDPAVTAAGTSGGNTCTYSNAGYRLMIVYSKKTQ